MLGVRDIKERHPLFVMSDSLSTYRLPCSVSGEDVRCVVRILGNTIRHNGPVQRAEPSYIFDLETQIAGEITVRGANGRLTVGVTDLILCLYQLLGKTHLINKWDLLQGMYQTQKLLLEV